MADLAVYCRPFGFAIAQGNFLLTIFQSVGTHVQGYPMSKRLLRFQQEIGQQIDIENVQHSAGTLIGQRSPQHQRWRSFGYRGWKGAVPAACRLWSMVGKMVVKHIVALAKQAGAINRTVLDQQQRAQCLISVRHESRNVGITESQGCPTSDMVLRACCSAGSSNALSLVITRLASMRWFCSVLRTS
ncbi:Uncharacterised protein [Serratia fonticola]|uniref:Uncharacterized protein n=1 Tax=Serratia fonticola TaxID=47917 RepID=A0A4U9W304_SERFO|nr:Uncharacterised protein [Serratia fonticola]